MSEEMVLSGKETRGRKCLLSKELQEQLCSIIKDVKYLSIACEAVGIHPQTAQRWLKIGEKHITAYHPDSDACTEQCPEDQVAFRSFFDSIKKARAESTQENLARIKKIGTDTDNFLPLAWIEERTRPDLFGLKNRTVHEHETGPVLSKLLGISQRKRIVESTSKAIELEENADGIFTEKNDPDFGGE